MVGGKWDGPGKDSILKELLVHDDLIWLDLPEDYRHALTPKSFMLMHFAHHHIVGVGDHNDNNKPSSSPSIDYLFKTDDDALAQTLDMDAVCEERINIRLNC